MTLLQLPVAVRSPVVVVTGYYPPHLGGVEACASHYGRELAALGHPVQVLTSAVGAGRGVTRDGDVVVRRFRALDVAHTPFAPALALALWRSAPGSVVHLHLSHVPTDVAGALVARLRGVPLVAHFHMDVPPSGRLGPVFTLYKRYVLPGVLRTATTVVALSHEQADLVVTRYGVLRSRVRVVGNGVELLPVAARGPSAPGPLQVLFVGRLAKQKNVARLLKAVSLVRAPVELHVVGDGELRAELEALAAALPHVVFRGELRGPALRARFAAADVFAVSSDVEGMPLAVLEAMAAGVPVLASDVPGLREHVAGRGLLVAPTAEAMAKGLDALAADPGQRRALAAAGRRYAETTSWATQAGLLSAVVDAAAGGPR